MSLNLPLGKKASLRDGIIFQGASGAARRVGRRVIREEEGGFCLGVCVWKERESET